MIVSGHVAGVPVEEMLGSFGPPVAIGIAALVYGRHRMARLGAGLGRFRRRRR